LDWLSTRGIFGVIYTVGSLILCVPLIAYLLYSDPSMVNTLSLGLIGSPERKSYFSKNVPEINVLDIGISKELKPAVTTSSDPLTLEAKAISEEYYKKAIIPCEGRYYFIEPNKNSITEIRDFSVVVRGGSVQGIDRDLNNIEWVGDSGIKVRIFRECALTDQASCGQYRETRGKFLFGDNLHYTLSLRKMRNKPWKLSSEVTKTAIMSCEEIKKHPIWKEPE
jgi:hypothetical protein